MSRGCPLCGGTLRPWRSLPANPSRASVGLPSEQQEERVIERCERCEVGVERGARVELEAEWAALDAASGVAVANRESVQASIGGEGWAAIGSGPGRLLHSPRSLELLAERTGNRIEVLGTPPLGRNQGWMWQTLVNGLTLRPNFARDARAGRIHPTDLRSRAAYGIDLVVSILAAPFVALISFPLELISALLGRGGELRARVPLAALDPS